MDTPLIKGPGVSFNRVNLTLGNTSILEDVSFTIDPGTIHCLIGPNGGGKTSLLRSLLGQMPHTGEIAITSPGPVTMGYVPQVLDFDHTLPITVDDFMAMVCQDRPAFTGIKAGRRPAIDRALSRVGLMEKRKRTMGQLSGGERQRLLLAQALLPFPGFLILDEPMTGLDKGGGRMLYDLLTEFKHQGVTIFWIHHDLKEVKAMADGVTCVNKGVLFSGPPDRVLSSQQILDAFSAR
ncbi:MAG: metal ABC transporter ATP-binding protein [Desulfobacteraceae bacterium]|nr:metal ABC transporter ATP-binding protein [Desulfobacteraceae bacterium]